VSISYQPVIGLEIHAQLQTNSKIFASDPVLFGQEANTLISPISLGHPGTLPKLNKKVVEFAIKMGLAIGGTEVLTKMILYFFHERLWFKFGKLGR
jgi:aspartyl-tRNA(Asn)/glutamyl-tRNA(Gln) amidotransferase subunit B